jgi:hypothetical protein
MFCGEKCKLMGDKLFGVSNRGAATDIGVGIGACIGSLLLHVV